MEDSVYSPGGENSGFGKSVRSGGGLFAKGINNQQNVTYSNIHIENNEEDKGDEVDPNFNEESDFENPRNYFVMDQRFVSVKNLVHHNSQLNQSNTPYMNHKNDDLLNRPSTSDNKNNRTNKFDFRMERPSTSKPKNYLELKKGRTKVLSQEEYLELQGSEKKKV